MTTKPDVRSLRAPMNALGGNLGKPAGARVRPLSPEFMILKRELGSGARGLPAAERRRHVALCARMEPKPTIKDLADLFGVSESTIGADQRRLRTRGISEELKARDELLRSVTATDPAVADVMKRMLTDLPGELVGDGLSARAWDGYWLSRETAEVARHRGDLQALTSASNSMFRWLEMLERRWNRVVSADGERDDEDGEEEIEFESDYGSGNG